MDLLKILSAKTRISKTIKKRKRARKGPRCSGNGTINGEGQGKERAEKTE